MRFPAVVALAVGLILASVLVASVDVNAADRTWIVTKGGGGPRSSAVSDEIAPAWPALWSVRVENAGLQSLQVDVTTPDGTRKETVVASQRLSFVGEPMGTKSTTPVSLEGGVLYNVTFTPRGTTGTYAVVTEVITPTVPVPPMASFAIAKAGLHVNVDASGSSDPNGDIASFLWEWGDGQTSGPVPEPTAAHDYAAAGTYTINLTVTDSTGLQDTSTQDVSVSEPTGPEIAYRFYDFFNVPWGEWWDYRQATYGDMAVNAECFNETSVANGICVPSDPNVPDVDTYPYTNWMAYPGSLIPENPGTVPLVAAPYRMDVVGAAVPGYTLAEPVFLPILNRSQSSGQRLDFDWKMDYLDKATGDYLTNVAACPGVDPAVYDGFAIRSKINLTMDLQESKRLFNVVGTDQSSAQNWWNTNTRPECYLNGPAETSVKNWFLAMGGGGSGSAGVGKYDIANSFQWYYVNFFLQISAAVDPDGTTHVSIDHAAWGTEVLLARMLYWGNTSYATYYLNSSRASGWMGMELTFWEDIRYGGSIRAADFDFTLGAAVDNHFRLSADPGPDGFFDQVNDVPYWTWGPILGDITNDFFTFHPGSELDRYPYPPYVYVHTTPGAATYGDSMAFRYAPVAWDLPLGVSWTFEFPSTPVVLYDPNLTPRGANPRLGQFVEVLAPLALFGTTPPSHGTWDAATYTWTVTGPSLTGGPPGAPGPDGLPGTYDDLYATEPWGAIRLTTAP